MIAVAEKVNELFGKLVPDRGAASTVAGEIVRAYNRLSYRFYNDGDKLGWDYGNETCNPAGRYLLRVCNRHFWDIICKVWYGDVNDRFVEDDEYEKFLEDLGNEVISFLETHPELKEKANRAQRF